MQGFCGARGEAIVDVKYNLLTITGPYICTRTGLSAPSALTKENFRSNV